MDTGIPVSVWLSEPDWVVPTTLSVIAARAEEQRKAHVKAAQSRQRGGR